MTWHNVGILILGVVAIGVWFASIPVAFVLIGSGGFKLLAGFGLLALNIGGVLWLFGPDLKLSWRAWRAS